MLEKFGNYIYRVYVEDLTRKILKRHPWLQLASIEENLMYSFDALFPLTPANLANTILQGTHVVKVNCSIVVDWDFLVVGTVHKV